MKREYPIQEHPHTINGVAGRMFTVHAPQEVRGNLVHLNQTWKSEYRQAHAKGFPSTAVMQVEIRFDDSCKNGHQSFAITAEINSSTGRTNYAAGCLHDEIREVFPELAPLIKWHLVSTDGPMHYLADTLYHASDWDYNGRAAGDPSSWETVIYFGNSPVAHKVSNKFASFIQERAGSGDFHVIALQHSDAGKQGAYQFGPKYTFVGFGERWYECPFDEEELAQQWAQALNTISYRFDRIITARSEGKPRDLDAARSSACWPEATDEELSADRDTVKAALEARLPALIADFRATMERIGFLWEVEK